MSLWSKNSRPEVFFCSCSDRDGLSQKMQKHWLGLGVRLILLTPKLLGCSDFDFQRLRRATAESLAKDPIYIVADDDMELITPLELGLKAMEEHPDFAMISAFPSNCSIHRWTPEGYEPFEDMSVLEHFSVGGIRICRRGAMFKGWPEQRFKGYDSEHCEALRRAGWRVGYSQHMRAIHHGEGKSSLYSQNVLDMKFKVVASSQ